MSPTPSSQTWGRALWAALHLALMKDSQACVTESR